MSTLQANTDDVSSALFQVTISDLGKIAFSSCSGLFSSVEVRYFESGGLLGPAKTARKTIRHGLITFSSSRSEQSDQLMSKKLLDWYIQVCDSSHALQKRTISIGALNSKNEVISEWKLVAAWPCEWRGPLFSQSDHHFAIEQVSFAHEGIENSRKGGE